MKRILKVSVIWLIASIILFTALLASASFRTKNMNIVEDEIFATMQYCLPLNDAINSYLKAYYFCEGKKDEFKFPPISAGFFPREVFAESACQDANRFRSLTTPLSIPTILLFGVGFLSLIVFVISGIVRSVKAKKIDNTHLKPSLVVFLGIMFFVLGASFSDQSNSHFSFKMQDLSYKVGDYASNIVDCFVELSNLFYEIHTLPESNSLSKIMMAKKKNESLLGKLKSIKEWDTSKDTHFPRYEDFIPQNIKTCEALDKYFKLLTSAYKNNSESRLLVAEANAELSSVLEEMRNGVEKAVHFSNNYMYITLDMFDKTALIKFGEMESGPEDAKYSLFLLFGYNVFKSVKEKSIKEKICLEEKGK